MLPLKCPLGTSGPESHGETQGERMDEGDQEGERDTGDGHLPSELTLLFCCRGCSEEPFTLVIEE